MIIEFIGVPGAGKSSLLPIAADVLADHGMQAYTVVQAARPFAARTLPGKIIVAVVPAKWRYKLLWQLFYQLSKLYRLRFHWQRQQLMQHVTSFQQRRPIAPNDRHHVQYWFHHHIGYYEFLKSRLQENEALLFDEGFVHRVVQLYASEIETPDLVHLKEYLDLIPQPDILIHPQTAKESCEYRVIERGIWQHFKHKSAADLSQYIENADVVVRFAAQQLRMQKWNILAVDNNAPTMSPAITHLRTDLSAFLQTARPISKTVTDRKEVELL